MINLKFYQKYLEFAYQSISSAVEQRRELKSFPPDLMYWTIAVSSLLWVFLLRIIITDNCAKSVSPAIDLNLLKVNGQHNKFLIIEAKEVDSSYFSFSF